MAAHRMLWHKGLQRCAQLTRKLGLERRLGGSVGCCRRLLVGQFLVGVQRRAEADRPLGADHHRNLLLPRVGRQQAIESFLQACNALIVVLPDLSEELEPLGRFRGRRDEIVIEREGVEKPWGRRNRA